MANRKSANLCVRLVIPNGCLCGSAMMVDGILCALVSLLRIAVNVMICLRLTEQPYIGIC